MSSEEKSEEKSSLDVTPTQQYGYTCKTVAISTVENYFAKKLGYPPFPIEKTIKEYKEYGIGDADIKKRTRSSATKSVREIAKNHGSIQGEILSLPKVGEILGEMGYKHQEVNFGDNQETFKASIKENIKRGNLIIGFFLVVKASVDRMGLPTIPSSESPSAEELKDYASREHAAVISGFDEATNEIEMRHWGRTWKTSFEDFYKASMLLNNEHVENHYLKKFRWSADMTGSKYKPAKRDEENSLIRKSITPEEGSGFRGKLIIIEEPKPGEILKMRGLRSPVQQRNEYEEAKKLLLEAIEIQENPDLKAKANELLSYTESFAETLSVDERRLAIKIFHDLLLLMKEPSFENFKKVGLNSYSKGIKHICSNFEDKLTKRWMSKLVNFMKSALPEDSTEKEKILKLYSKIFSTHLTSISNVDISALETLFQQRADLVMGPLDALKKPQLLEKYFYTKPLEGESGIDMLKKYLNTRENRDLRKKVANIYFSPLSLIETTKETLEAIKRHGETSDEGKTEISHLHQLWNQPSPNAISASSASSESLVTETSLRAPPTTMATVILPQGRTSGSSSPSSGLEH